MQAAAGYGSLLVGKGRRMRDRGTLERLVDVPLLFFHGFVGTVMELDHSTKRKTVKPSTLRRVRLVQN